MGLLVDKKALSIISPSLYETCISQFQLKIQQGSANVTCWHFKEWCLSKTGWNVHADNVEVRGLRLQFSRAGVLQDLGVWITSSVCSQVLQSPNNDWLIWLSVEVKVTLKSDTGSRGLQLQTPGLKYSWWDLATLKMLLHFSISKLTTFRNGSVD